MAKAKKPKKAAPKKEEPYHGKAGTRPETPDPTVQDDDQGPGPKPPTNPPGGPPPGGGGNP